MRSKLGYLNFILTVIAIGVTVLVLQNANLIPEAMAENKPLLPLNANGALPVEFKNGSMSVFVENIETDGSGNLKVSVEDWSAGTIPVENQ